MNEVIFDFDRISGMDDFYTTATRSMKLPGYFGNNFDALWDSVTGGIQLPAHVKFINMTMNQLETFDKLIIFFEEAAEELGDNLQFEYYIKKD